MRTEAAVIILVATLTSFTATLGAGERAKLLSEAVKNADRLVITDAFLPPSLRQFQKKPIEIKGEAAIAELISNLEFDEGQVGRYCACAGDSAITFYKGEKELVKLSHHHGESLRWNGASWDGDSFFAGDSAAHWRAWFKKHGAPRFEHMHEERLAELRRAREIQEQFLAPFPAEASKIFARAELDGMVSAIPEGNTAGDDTLSPGARELIGVFAARTELGLAVSRGLGSLAARELGDGNWSIQTGRVSLALQAAGVLTGAEFMDVLEAADDQGLLGAARLFFFEKMGEKLPAEAREEWTPKLCEVVLRLDRSGNSDSAMRYLGASSSENSLALLEALAAGEISPQGDPRFRQPGEPMPRAAACLLLAKRKPSAVSAYVKEIKATGEPNEIDEAALKVALALGGERGGLDKSIFDIPSFTIGYGALQALENEGGRAALDAIIDGGTKHMWAAIREDSVLTAERMMGKKWLEDMQNERFKQGGKSIREWWAANRDSFPETGPVRSKN